MKNSHLQANPERLAGAVLSLFMACIFLELCFGFDFISGKSGFWRTEFQDLTQQISGFNFYFTSPWTLPLLKFDSLNYPHGTLVTFVDAVPFFAFLLKIFLPQNWSPFNPYSAWLAICFLLQALGAWWIARELKTKSWLFLIALTFLLINFPPLLDRIHHISLMAHWMILFSIAIYLKGREQNELPIVLWTWLLTIGFYINIYLFAMVSGVFACSWLSQRARFNARSLIMMSTPFLILFISSMLMIFPMPGGKVFPENGFGIFSMNLLSPLIGGSIFPPKEWMGLNAIAGFTHVGGPGQYEGFNYLGLGILLLIALNFLTIVQSAFRHKAFSLLLLFVTAYALSGQILFGKSVLLEFNYPEFLTFATSQFRASGRFFWLVGYVLCVISLYHSFRKLSVIKFGLLVVAVFVVQVVDMQRVYLGLQARINRQDPVVINQEKWREALGVKTEVIYVYPKFKCGKDTEKLLVPFMKYASEHRLKMNTGYIARYTPDCGDVQQEIENSNPTNSAYVFNTVAFPEEKLATQLFPLNWKTQCVNIDIAYICRARERIAPQ